MIPVFIRVSASRPTTKRSAFAAVVVSAYFTGFCQQYTRNSTQEYTVTLYRIKEAKENTGGHRRTPKKKKPDLPDSPDCVFPRNKENQRKGKGKAKVFSRELVARCAAYATAAVQGNRRLDAAAVTQKGALNMKRVKRLRRTREWYPEISVEPDALEYIADRRRRCCDPEAEQRREEEHALLMRWVRREMGRRLSAQERQMVEMYYLEMMTLAQVARNRKVHPSTVSRTVRRSVGKLRRAARHLAGGEEPLRCAVLKAMERE